MNIIRTLPALAVAVVLTVSCGDGDAGPGDSTTSPDVAVTTTATPAETTTTIEVPATSTTAMATTTIATTTTTIEVVGVEQPAIWPAADVVFASPQEAAADFVLNALGVAPVLGDFQAGDARSGEIEVFSPGESNPVSRGLVFLRQLGPSDGWFVLGAANPNASITVPDLHAEVVAGPLTVEGVARGFEATVVVTAFLAGDADAVFDQVITSGGAFETPEPYSVSLDLTGASPGDVVTVLVRGGTGLETDPGDFGAIPVVIAG